MKIENPTTIPNSILAKLYDNTGTSSGGNRGFVLVYVNPDGVPVITSKVENACIGMALRKTLEVFLDEENEGE